MRTALRLVALAVLCANAAPAGAQWVPGGVPVCGVGCRAGLPKVIADDAGGVYVTWRDGRAPSAPDVYLQRITSAGTIAPGWPAEGLPVCTLAASQVSAELVLDGVGGVHVVWTDQRSFWDGSGTGQDIFVQRIMGDGTIAPGWPVDGAAATRANGSQLLPRVAADGVGGVFAAWTDRRNEVTNASDIYAQHLTAVGEVALGWPADGLAVAALPAGSTLPRVIPDGTGGMLVVWDDARGGVFGQRLHSDGTIAAGWPEGGRLMAAGRWRAQLEIDGAGGFYLATATLNEFLIEVEYRVQRLDMDGDPAPGWPAEGVLVCADPAWKGLLHVASDGQGGLLLPWEDYRLPSGIEVFTARVLPDGTRPWTADGVLVSGTELIANEYEVGIAPDGSGGAYVVWEQATIGTRVLIQHLDASGAVATGWPVGGLDVHPEGDDRQFVPRVVSDGAGGAIVVWEDRGTGLFAQRFQIDGPVAVELSLQGADAEPDRVTLIWRGTGAGALDASVERRGEADDWRRIGAAEPDGADRLRYEDRDVVAAARYAYRLAYLEEGIERRSAETWVEVPAALRLALEGFRPNPARGAARIAFTLPREGEVRLEMLDVSGRRVWGREAALSAGRHAIVLDQAAPLAPGVYLIRLQHAGEVLVARGAVVR